MDNEEKKNNKKMFQEGVFPFGKFKKMAEMMRKMMGQEGRGEKKEKEGP
jgi:hypothetical protein